MRLKALRLERFKGLTAIFNFPAEGDTAIIGENGTGKTTILDAYSWLLTDADGLGGSKAVLKTLDGGHSDTEVEAIFDLGGGRDMSLRKVLREKWTQPRGRGQKVFSGHETEYLVNHVSCPRKDYMSQVSRDIGTDEEIKVLINPLYFAERLPWQDRRRLLASLCEGQFSPPKASEVSAKALARHKGDWDAARKDALQKVRGASKGIDTFAGRIEEASRGITPHSGASIAALTSRIQKWTVEIERMQKKKADAVPQDAVFAIRTELANAKMAFQREIEEAIYRAQAEAQDHSKQENDHREQCRALRTEERILADAISSRTQAMGSLRQEFEALRTAPAMTGDCPTCGQAWAAGAREEMAKRSQRLARINQEWRQMQEINERQQVELNALVVKLEAQAKNLEEQAIKSQEAHGKVTALRQQLVDLPSFPEIESRLAQAEKDAAVGHDPAQEAEIDAAIASLAADREKDLQQMAKIEASQAAQARVDELTIAHRQVVEQMEAAEQELAALDDYAAAQAAALEEAVNQRLTLCKVSMFTRQVNGEIAQRCEILGGDAGVPFSAGLNTAARVNVGLDIINAFSRHWGKSFPVIIDNAESVLSLIDTPAQTIRLVAVADEPTLKMV